ncbi:MAG: ester cyclase [Anaerolineales bacterium]|nr:ester cyclase [Anaerolineales bacterium]
MSTESNKALIRKYREIHNTDQLQELDNLLAKNFKPNALLPGMSANLETFKQIHQMSKASFPDLMIVTEDLIAEGDKVVERWVQTMTHSGASFMNIPPSNNKIIVSGISIYRIADGKIAEHWGNMDMFAMMVQLGAIPMPSA